MIRPCLNTTTFTETQCSVAPSGSGAIAAAATAAAVAEGEEDLVPAPERESMACKFVLEGEGDKFVSGVEGVWIIGMGDADAEFGFKFRVVFGLNKFGSGALLLMVFASEVEVPAAADDCCSFLDACERVEVGFRCVTKR